MELRKTSQTNRLSLQKVAIGLLSYTIPENWVFTSSDEGFTLYHQEYNNVQISCYRSDKPVKKPNLGSQYVVRYNKILWEKRSAIQKEGRLEMLATSFSTQLQGQIYTIELTSKPSEHSYALQKVIKSFLEGIQINGKM